MKHFRAASQVQARRRGAAVLSHILTSHRCATQAASGSSNNSNSDGGERRGGLDVDAVARPMGYGPFSATAKARVLREKAEAHASNNSGADTATEAGHPSTVMHNVTLHTNLSLRLSLAGLPHPSQLQEWAYTSPEWRLAFVRLYRTILRLHNKTVAVSLRTSRGAGPAAAVSAVTGVQTTDGGEEGADGAATAAAAAPRPTRAGKDDVSHSPATTTPAEDDDYLLRYLLTPEQQEFGNRFVQGEFHRHMDADAVSAAIFYASWYDYVLQLASGVTSRPMTEKEKRLLSEEQKEKLNALRGAFVDLRMSKEPQYMP